MIEAYAFLAMFAIQIVVASVLYPAWLIRHVRARVESFPAERFAELFPGVDRSRSAERFATRYRALNTGVALLGLLVLGWLFGYLRRPDWREGPVQALATGYFLVQYSPLVLVAIGNRYRKVLAQSLAEGKRRALLQRRGLFDFVSPFTVICAVLSYFIFAALVIYIRQSPFPGFGGFINIGIITLLYAFNAFVAYRSLYGRKRNPLVPHADRVRAIGAVVKSVTYACIAVTVYASLNLTLSLLDLRRWELFGLSFFFVICTLLGSLPVIASPRQPNSDGCGSNGQLPPGKVLS
jgi:hypothetical protein